MIKASTAQDYRERIVRTLVYIQQHLDDDADINAAASEAAFSPFHFHRIFRGLVGETLRKQVRRLRLERAARHLKQRPGESIVQLALEAGFETHESFTRAFHNMFNVSPSAYRDAHKPAPDSASGTHLDDVSGYHAPGHPDVPPVELKDLPPARIVFLRHVGPYHEVGATWGRLMSWAGKRRLLGPGMKLIGIVHDDPDSARQGPLRRLRQRDPPGPTRGRLRHHGPARWHVCRGDAQGPL
jgi:AraC family transcriptional regulator